ncbi:hypothetical protein [Brevundimonas sp.]|uniref:hypothetical protein n=1 Tax=Brevundimonas sp. TaxID=1871086 RepID=UPI0025F3EED7|nr:hypothetical protein [Brevundimonas sp.]
MVRSLLFAAVVLIAGAAEAQSIHTPAPGTPERRAILDAIRPEVEADLGPPVEFVVEEMRVSGTWAFVHAEPQRPGGGRIDAPHDDFQDGNTTYAVLRRRDGRWRPLMVAVGPSDVPWVVFCDEAPRGLFGPVC